MRTSDEGIDLIQRFEGLEDGDPDTPGLDPYLCPAGIATIGWGHVVRDERGNRLEGWQGLERAGEIYPDGITRAEAEDLLADDLRSVERMVSRYVEVDLSQNEFDALISFTFNLGSGNLKRSTLLDHLNAGKKDLAAGEFWKWRRANGEILRGLVRRRAAEKALFTGGRDVPDNP